jgi:ribosome-associated protein
MFNKAKMNMDHTKITFTLTTEYIELYKLLKLEGLVSSGAEAKMLIADGHVRVNNETELRKRKKIIIGDIIEFDAQTISVHSPA